MPVTRRTGPTRPTSLPNWSLSLSWLRSWQKKTGNEIAAPPTALYAKDLKTGYNVTTPAQAFVYWNTLQHKRSGAEVLGISIKLAQRAMARAEAKLKRTIAVMTYAELAERVPSGKGSAKAEELAKRGDLDLPERTKLLTQHLWSLSGLAGPAVVLGFGSIPYSAVSLKSQELAETITSTVKISWTWDGGLLPRHIGYEFCG